METYCSGLSSPVLTVLDQRRTGSQDKGSQADTSDFQSMLDQKRTTFNENHDGKCDETRTCKEETTQKKAFATGEETTDADLEAHKQMAWTFLAVLQNPVIQDSSQASADVSLGAVASDSAIAEGLIEYAVPIQETRTVEPAAMEGNGAEVMGTELMASHADDVMPAVQSGGAGENQGQAAGEQDAGWTIHNEDVEHPDMPAGEQMIFQNIREIPVKVGEVSGVRTPVETNTLEEQLNVRLCQAVRDGETVVELQLEPENLGSIQVKLAQSEDGALHISIYAENSHTRTLLERDLAGLQSMLGRNTQQDVQIEVSHQESSHQQSLYDDGNHDNGNQGHQQEHQQERQQNDESFLQRLRLGLDSLNVAAS